MPAPFNWINMGPMRKAKNAKQPKALKVVCGVFTNGESILLFKKKENDVYEFPGGKVEKDEPYKNALVRELKEELEYVGREEITYFTSVRGLAGERKILLRAYKIHAMPKGMVLHEHLRVEKMDLTVSALKKFLKKICLGIWTIRLHYGYSNK